jgi:hypothetical protein
VSGEREYWLKLDIERMTVAIAFLTNTDGKVMVDNDALDALVNGKPSELTRHAGETSDTWYVNYPIMAELMESRGYQKWVK